jgi:hypothetical protein
MRFGFDAREPAFSKIFRARRDGKLKQPRHPIFRDNCDLGPNFSNDQALRLMGFGPYLTSESA